MAYYRTKLPLNALKKSILLLREFHKKRSRIFSWSLFILLSFTSSLSLASDQKDSLSEDDGLVSAQHTAMSIVTALFKDEDQEKTSEKISKTPEVERKVSSSSTNQDILSQRPQPTSLYSHNLEGASYTSGYYLPSLPRFHLAQSLVITTSDPTISLQETQVILNYRYSYGYGFFSDYTLVLPPPNTSEEQLIISLSQLAQHLRRRHHLGVWDALQWGRVDFFTAVYGRFPHTESAEVPLQKNESEAERKEVLGLDKKAAIKDSSTLKSSNFEDIPIEYPTIFSTCHFLSTPALMVPSLYDQLRIDLRFVSMWHHDKNQEIQVFHPHASFARSPYCTQASFRPWGQHFAG